MGVTASGAENRRLYVNSIDEAMQRAARDGKKHPGPRQPRRQIADIAIRRMKDTESLAREQRKLLVTKAGDPEFARAFNATTKSITNLLSEVRRNYESERKAFGGLTEEQLEQVFKAQLARIAPKLEESERRMMLEIWFGPEIAEVLLKPREIAMATEPRVVSHVMSCGQARGGDALSTCTCPSSSELFGCLQCGRQSVRYLDSTNESPRCWCCDHCGPQGGIQPRSNT